MISYAAELFSRKATSRSAREQSSQFRVLNLQFLVTIATVKWILNS
jgi:hypothetical protein